VLAIQILAMDSLTLVQTELIPVCCIGIQNHIGCLVGSIFKFEVEEIITIADLIKVSSGWQYG
jgi:hypothetical protein